MFKFVYIKELMAGVILGWWLINPAHTEPNKNEFKGKSLYDLSKIVSEATGYTIVFSPRVRLNREVEIYSTEDMPKDELFQVYQSILSLYGYAAVLNDSVVRVVRERKARSMPIPVISDDNN